jgi:phage terminase small subunit
VGLTPKQQTFVDEYLVDLNATQAAIRAGYSKKTARSQGERMLTNVDVAAAIQKGFQKRSERTQITAEKVLLELAVIAFADLQQLADMGGRISDKLKALELIGKHLGMFTEKVENKVTGPDGGPVQYDIRMTFVRPQRRDDGAGD